MFHYAEPLVRPRNIHTQHLDALYWPLRIDIAESMANDTRLWDGTKTTEPPAPKKHVWPDNMRPVLRTSGPASTHQGKNASAVTGTAKTAQIFTASSTGAKKKLKKGLKRKFLVSPGLQKATGEDQPKEPADDQPEPSRLLSPDLMKETMIKAILP